jgi:hypothetical protein
MTVTTEQMTLFSGTAVMVRWHGPNSGDDRVNDTVLGCDGDSDIGGGGWGGSDVFPTTEEERDGMVPGMVVKARQTAQFSGATTTWR